MPHRGTGRSVLSTAQSTDLTQIACFFSPYNILHNHIVSNYQMHMFVRKRYHCWCEGLRSRESQKSTFGEMLVFISWFWPEHRNCVCRINYSLHKPQHMKKNCKNGGFGQLPDQMSFNKTMYGVQRFKYFSVQMKQLKQFQRLCFRN